MIYKIVTVALLAGCAMGMKGKIKKAFEQVASESRFFGGGPPMGKCQSGRRSVDADDKSRVQPVERDGKALEKLYTYLTTDKCRESSAVKFYRTARDCLIVVTKWKFLQQLIKLCEEGQSDSDILVWGRKYPWAGVAATMVDVDYVEAMYWHYDHFLKGCNVKKVKANLLENLQEVQCHAPTEESTGKTAQVQTQTQPWMVEHGLRSGILKPLTEAGMTAADPEVQALDQHRVLFKRPIGY